MANNRKSTGKVRVSQLPHDPYCFAERHTFLILGRNRTLRDPAATPLARAAALEVSVLVALDEGDVASALIAAGEAYAAIEHSWRAG